MRKTKGWVGYKCGKEAITGKLVLFPSIDASQAWGSACLPIPSFPCSLHGVFTLFSPSSSLSSSAIGDRHFLKCKVRVFFSARQILSGGARALRNPKRLGGWLCAVSFCLDANPRHSLLQQPYFVVMAFQHLLALGLLQVPQHCLLLLTPILFLPPSCLWYISWLSFKTVLELTSSPCCFSNVSFPFPPPSSLS